MNPVLATSVFTDPGHIVVIAIPIVGLIAYLFVRRSKGPASKPDVFDPTSHERGHDHHGAGHPPGHQH